MTLSIDHVAFAWNDLDALVGHFAGVGLEPEYGGAHGGGATHMSVLGFEDGSYIELIAPNGDPDQPVPFWGRRMRGQAGPCAWCVEVDDVADAVKRAVDAGVAVGGPWYNSRTRPDGTLVEWDMAFLGVDQTGTDDPSWVLPFYISDRTPRSYRVQPVESTRDSSFHGIGTVVVGVHDLEATVDRFRRLFRVPTPITEPVGALDARVAAFPGTSVALATPDPDSAPDEAWLAERLSEFGPGPCAYLLGTDDLEATGQVTEPSAWPTGRVAWFDQEALDPVLGAVTRTER